MKFGLKQVAVLVALMFGANMVVSGNVHAQLSPALQTQLNAAMIGSPIEVLAKLNALMAANPTAIGALATAAGGANNALAVQIGGAAATALSNSGLPAATQDAQMSQASTGLATANPAAALAIVQAVAAAAPDLTSSAGAGASTAPGVSPSDVASIAQTVTTAGGGNNNGGNNNGGNNGGNNDDGVGETNPAIIEVS